MIDYSQVYTKYVSSVELSHMERFNVLLFMIYVETRNIPFHLFNAAFDEYSKVAEPEDLRGVNNFLQRLQEEKVWI